MSVEAFVPAAMHFTANAANKVKTLITEEGNPDFIVDSENGRTAIDVKVFGETCETIISLLNFHKWEA